MRTPGFYCTWIVVTLLSLAACSPISASLPSPSAFSTQAPAQARIETPEPGRSATGPEATRSGGLPGVTPASQGSSPSLAPLPSLTPTPIQTATQEPTRTVSGTPWLAFAGFRLEFVDYSVSYGMQFAFIIPGIQQNYELDVNGKPYTCYFYEKYPDRLFCMGQVIAPQTKVKLSFLTLDSEKREVYTTTLVIPTKITPTVDPTLAKGFTPDNCPVRGVNVRCETEYRVLGNGCCVVSTCVDACGYYYSVDTCPEGMAWEGICQGTPPPFNPPIP